MKAAIKPTHSSGYTVIEIAIVLVIIALLIGSVLQGRSVVRSMQVKDLLTIAKDLSIASASFRERYHYLPGDWPFTANEIPNVVSGGNGNGLITAGAPCGAPCAGESANVPNHLFNAGFITGGAGPIRSRFGAVRVVGNTAAAGSIVAAGPNPIPATTLNVIEFDNLPCDVVIEMETRLDDGVLSTGNARASVASCIVDGLNDPVPTFAIPL